ncbi:transcription factor jumonjihydroxylase [Fusarium phyllophilum]|uniref:Transcription factor jumonjihydroxylase n=1 Tax=Fusarium phyllophilum TaxID=47803 RepID=A0A8H5N6J5_9HYPO|nr:transcription factor jumonjihydroxylase [Fusarium phyllophilum]
MTVVKEPTEDLVTVIVAGVGQGPMPPQRQARYLDLYPGQTIYMPPGTIHYVFRKQSDPNIITGGFGRVASCYFEFTL